MILNTEPPALPRPFVARPALADRILAHRVALLQAPAGYGKSVLLAEALHRARCPVALCALTAADRDPDRLIAGLGRALASVAAHENTAACESVAVQEVVLAIDGAEALAGSPDAWGALGRWVAGLPDGCRLILAGRTLAPLGSLARRRLAGELLQFGPGDLLFSECETRAFLDLMGTAEADAHRLADGWPAALRLLAAGQPLTEVLAYVEAEVAAALSPEDRGLLADLSVTGEWTPQACNWLLERADGDQLLAAWEGALPVDRQGRVHPLVRRFFAAVLEREPVRRRRLQRRAALWAMEYGLPEAALDHALAAEDIGLAVPLLRQVGQRLLAAGRLEEVDAWLARTPAAALDAAPDLLLAAGEALRRGGHPRRAVRWLQAAAVGFAADGQSGGVLRSFCRLAHAHADLGQWSEVEAAIRQVEAEAASAAGRDRAEALRTLAEYALWVGQSEAAAERFRTAARLFLDDGDREGAGAALLGMGAGALVALGRLDEALAALRESQALLGGAAGCEAVLAEAQILLEQGRRAEAEAVLPTAEPHGPQQRALLLWTRARIALERGDRDAARRWMAEGEAALSGIERTPLLRGQVLLLEGWLALAGGMAGKALACGRQASRIAAEHRTGLPLLHHSAERLAASAEAAVRAGDGKATLVSPMTTAASGPPAAGGAGQGLRVECFGSFRLLRGDREVPLSHWGRAQVRSLLQCLLLQPGFAAPRELLLETLWPEESPEQSRARLRVVLNRLRQALLQLGCTLEASTDIIRLPQEAIAAVDLLTFRRHLAAARSLAPRTPEACLEHCRAGRALYRGSLLQDAFWPGVEVHRRQAQRELSELLELWQEAAVRVGRTEEAVTVLEELLALEPGHEAAARTLMGLLIRGGRRGEALHRYRQLARWLKGELGLDPAPETQALFRMALD